jgi:hypothetical protein
VTEPPETVRNVSSKLEPTAPEPIAEASASSRVKDCVNKCRHFLIVGDKDQGKSALGYSILEAHHENTTRPCFVYRPPKPQLLPKWITPIANLDELPQGAVCLIDEASKDFDQYSYRNSWNRQLAEKLQIARHKDQSIILVYQTTKRANSNLLYPIDVYLLKKPTVFQRLEERALIQNAYRQIQGTIQKNEYYWLDGDVLEKGTFTKPPWYTEELSKAYSGSPPQGSQRPVTPVRSAPETQKFIQPQPVSVQSRFRSKANGPIQPSLVTKIAKISNHLPVHATEKAGTSFDPAGLILVAIVGMFGLISLLRDAWGIAIVCLLLAAIGLLFSHSHFDRR